MLEAALIGPERVAEALGGVGPRAATRSSSPPTRCTARSAALAGSGRAARRAAGRRRAGAGRAQRRRRLRGRGAARARARGGGRRRDPEAVGRPAHRRREELLLARAPCSAPAPLAHRLGIPHLTLDLETRLPRARSSARFVDGYRAGRTPNPCVICNGELRIDAMIALADRLGCAALATGHYARIADDGEGPLLARRPPTRPRIRPTCSPASPGVAGAAAFPARRADQARGARDSRPPPGCRWPSKAESQDLCFLAGEGKRSLPRPPRRARRAPRARSSTARGRRLGEHRGHHQFTVGQRRGLGVGARRAPLRARHRRARRTRSSSARARSSRPAGSRSATRPCTGPAAASTGSCSATTRARSRARCRRSRPAPTTSSSSSSPSPPTASRRARPPACFRATWSSAARRSPDRFRRRVDRVAGGRWQARRKSVTDGSG